MWARLSGISWKWWVAVGIALLLLGGGANYWLVDRGSDRVGEADGRGRGKTTGVKADVVGPKPGGIPRLCTQPGSAEPFLAAALYAKVFGQLKTLTVDIGDRVKKGDLLAEIDIPEYEAQVARNKAKIDDATAKLKQNEARKTEAEAEARAAESSVTLASIMVKAKSAFRQYRERQLERVKILVEKKAEDQRLQDEQEDYYLSALEAENAAKEKVNAEQERATAARVKITRVGADIEAARADIEVAKAELANSEVWVRYGQIHAPFDGVITQRGYLRGDFIKAGDQSGSVPIVTLASTDVLRVVIPVPDRDVPFVAPGKPAILTFDALPGVTYQTTKDNKVVVSRLAESEDYQTRLMRVEVDVRNEDGRLKPGMYGRATLVLTGGTPGAMQVPTAALAGRGDGDQGTVRVVRDGKLQTVPVTFGADNGIAVEILSGLTPRDQVVIATNVPAPDGTATVTRSATPGP